jgi:hypothetical protein
MKAKFINEIKRDAEGTGLSAVGVGHIATLKGHIAMSKLMGVSRYNYTQMTDPSIIKINHPIRKKVLENVEKSMHCKLDDMIFLSTDIFSGGDIRWKFLDETVFDGWRKDEGNFIHFRYEPDTIFNKDMKLEYTIRVESWTSTEWGISQIILYKEFTKTFERTGDTYFCIRYK